MKITKSYWGTDQNKEISLFHFDNGNMELSVTNFGAAVTSILVPDKAGKKENIVLCYNSLDAYINDIYYTGGIVGRYAGRISGGAFTIGRSHYLLTANDSGTGNHLHGGIAGFNKKVFEVIDHASNEKEAILHLHYKSLNMEEGYPGNLDVWISYTLTAGNDVIIDYKAVTDQTTHINLTNHSYFNLTGSVNRALDQQLFINADYYLTTDERYIPTGEMAAVKDTPYDFRMSRKIGAFCRELSGFGYNECFVLNQKKCHNRIDAGLFDPFSGRMMTITTSFPSVLLYTGGNLNKPFKRNSGICLETQFFPDTPNRSEFQGTLLEPGKEFVHVTRFSFSW